MIIIGLIVSAIPVVAFGAILLLVAVALANDDPGRQ
jgi:hypothetical protein